MERESYGEDIANTETERSDCSDEDDYEDSFIDDDADPEVYPPSPISNEGMLDDLSSSLKEVSKYFYFVPILSYLPTYFLELVKLCCEYHM